MNLYAREPVAFGPDDEELGRDLASASGSVLADVAACASIVARRAPADGSGAGEPP